MARHDPSAFGVLLRRQRIDAGLTQEDLAEQAQVSARTISDIERGVIQTPQIHTVHQSADALGLAPDDREQLLRTGSGRVPEHGASVPVTRAIRSPDDVERPGTDARLSQRLLTGGYLGALPAGPLVARDCEFSRILTAVDAVASGEGRLALLVGEPGAGKTRLAQEVTLSLRDRGFLIATGRCYESRQVVPYYPFLEVLATAVALSPSTIRDEIPQR